MSSASNSWWNFISETASDAADYVSDAYDDTKLAVGRGFMDAAESTFDFLGFDDAARNIRRYRSGQGGTLNYSDQEIGKHESILEAEDTNRTRIESQTFTGKSDNSRLLKSLADGQTTTFNDYWKRPISSLNDPNTYLTFGRAEILSDGDFNAIRRGNSILIKGTVQNGFDTDQNDNLFDFNPGQPGSTAARILEDEQARTGNPEGKPFAMQFDRKQDVEAEIRIEPNGSLRLLRSNWGKIY